MKAYSLDLRQRVVDAIENGEGTIEEVAALFGVGPTFVKKMLRQWRHSHDLSPLPHGGGRAPALNAKQVRTLEAEVKRSPDATLDELRVHLKRTHRIQISPSALSRRLSRMGLPRKKSV